MPLRLRQAVAGRPNLLSTRNVDVFAIGERGYVAYPSGSNITVLTSELELEDTLPFWTALPHRASASIPSNVEGVCCSQEHNLIIAWSDVHVVFWQYISTRKVGSWAVYSTILASSPVKSLDFRAGALVLGTQNGIEYWRMDPQAEVVVWDRLWERSYPAPTSIHLSPASGHIAWFREGQKSAYILATDRKGQAIGMAQEIRHPREISWIGWRKPSQGSSDSHLYTITTNSVFRIYSPVLDDPLWFQLLSSLDHRAFSKSLRHASAKGKEPEANPFGSMWVWDADVLRIAVQAELNRINDKQVSVSAQITTILQGLDSEESDIIAWISPDGYLVLRSVVNIERKPPTLLKTLLLSSCQLPPLSSPSSWTSGIHLLPIPGSIPTLLAIIAPSKNHPSITSYRLSLKDVLSSKLIGVKPTSRSLSADETGPVQLEHPLEKFARTPNGRGLLAIGENGEIGTWYKQQLSVRPGKWHVGPRTLVGKGHWNVPQAPQQAALFAKGRAIVFYTKPPDGQAVITLQHLDSGHMKPREPVILPHFQPSADDDVKMLLAVSDIDDGYGGGSRRTQRAIITAATRNGEAWVWRVISKVTPQEGDLENQPTVQLVSHYRLPIDADHTQGGKPKMILPVDPMGWHQSVIDWSTDTALQDMILSVSTDGDLEFWTPKIGGHLVEHKSENTVKHGDTACQYDGAGSDDRVEEAWIKTGTVRTGRSNVVMARCSSRKKTVLVCKLEDGRHELTVWDSKVSEFSTGLELTHIFEQGETIQDLDWTTTSDLQSVLAVGFPHKVVLVCEQRMSYVETTPGWAPFITIDMKRYTPVPISDSIWLAGGSLAVGTGNQIYLFSRFLGRDTPSPTPAGSIKSVTLDEEEPEDIFQLIAHRNGPLVDYHPVQLGQCLLWDKTDLVKSILLELSKSLKQSEEEGKKRIRFHRLDPSEFYSTKKRSKPTKASSNKYDGLFDSIQPPPIEEEDEFTERLVAELIERLNGKVALPLSSAEKSFLATMAQATLEAEQQRRSLDVCGMRYLISLRMYVNWDKLSNTTTIAPSAMSTNSSDFDQSSKEQKGTKHFSFRNVVWASHSESKELLLSASKATCKDGKMLWEDARRMGVFLWLKPGEVFKSQLEDIARNRFMQDENRDPTSCSLIFFALGKKKVVHGLWRQAPGHKEQALMLKFLANDFDLDRWKTAAMKNAYALLSKQRYDYAAAFFMLGGAPKDAINVCLRHLNDWQLGIALARAVEPNEAEGKPVGPLMRWILEDTVLPMAFAGGHRWLASWAFWTLGRRDLAVKILISPMTDIATEFSADKAIDVGNPDNDDPSLLLMFRHLKSKSLQTAKGTSEISNKLEYDFVLHNARVFFRMGCHNLALDLLRSWSFERPFFPVKTNRNTRTQSIAPPTPTTISPTSTISTSPIRPTLFGLGTITNSYIGQNKNRRPSFMLTGDKRRESFFMDIDVLAESSANTSETPTPHASQTPNGATTPETQEPEEITKNYEKENISEQEQQEDEKKEEDEEKVERSPPPKKSGNLMKELKQDVQQGAMEFNMDNFF